MHMKKSSNITVERGPFYVTDKAVAKRRTENIVKRLSKEPKLLVKYGEIVAEQEKRGFIKMIDATNVSEEPTKIHYIPLHADAMKKDLTPMSCIRLQL